jgi:hypothetical protein
MELSIPGDEQSAAQLPRSTRGIPWRYRWRPFRPPRWFTSFVRQTWKGHPIDPVTILVSIWSSCRVLKQSCKASPVKTRTPSSTATRSVECAHRSNPVKPLEWRARARRSPPSGYLVTGLSRQDPFTRVTSDPRCAYKGDNVDEPIFCSLEGVLPVEPPGCSPFSRHHQSSSRQSHLRCPDGSPSPSW